MRLGQCSSVKVCIFKEIFSIYLIVYACACTCAVYMCVCVGGVVGVVVVVGKGV